MNLHEYQSKRLFADYGIPVPRGIPADSADAAVKAAEELGGELWVVKAQVHAGGRGKAGGVKLARTLDEVHEYADAMLGETLVTHQTGPEGLPIHTVYVEQGSDIDRELYLSMLVDREVSRISFIASAAGGMDIEKVAAETPEKIFSVAVAPDAGLQDYQARILGFGLELDKQQLRQFGDLIAEGIVTAVKDVGVSVPVVVRLEGTNVEKGREILASSGLDIIAADDLTDAALKVVAAAG